jgi:hypothetical protein
VRGILVIPAIAMIVAIIIVVVIVIVVIGISDRIRRARHENIRSSDNYEYIFNLGGLNTDNLDFA